QAWLGCLLTSCCTTTGLITICAVVVISLIPVYLGTQGGPTTNPNKQTTLELTFSTDYSIPSGGMQPAVENMQDLAREGFWFAIKERAFETMLIVSSEYCYLIYGDL
ncbi:unnamed protein product, partial [Adineta steineri]